jgi:DNA-binding response OmpR family regulator
MARLLIVEPEADFHTFFDAALAQAGYVALEAANSYAGRPSADTVCVADGTRDRREPVRARLLMVEAEAQFHPFFCDVLAYKGYVVTVAVTSDAGRPAADTADQVDVRRDIRYLVIS